MQPIFFEEVVKGRYGEAALQRNQPGLVILIAILVEHYQDLIQERKDKKRMPANQFRVLHGDMRR